VIAAGVSALIAGGVGFALSRSGGSNASATNAGTSSTASNNAAPAGARNGTRGKVTKVDGSDITVDATDRNGTTSSVVVRTSADTTFTQSVSGTVSDVKAGDNVVVMGTDSSGTVAATSIMDSGDTAFAGRGGNGNGAQPGTPPSDGNFTPPHSGANGRPGGGFAGRGFHAGQVTAVNGSSFTISSIDGTEITVTTDSSTTVNVTRSASISDVKTGDTIMATGTNDNGVVTATSVRIGDAGFVGGFPGGAPPQGATPGEATSSGN